MSNLVGYTSLKFIRRPWGDDKNSATVANSYKVACISGSKFNRTLADIKVQFGWLHKSQVHMTTVGNNRNSATVANSYKFARISGLQKQSWIISEIHVKIDPVREHMQTWIWVIKQAHSMQGCSTPWTECKSGLTIFTNLINHTLIQKEMNTHVISILGSARSTQSRRIAQS